MQPTELEYASDNRSDLRGPRYPLTRSGSLRDARINRYILDHKMGFV